MKSLAIQVLFFFDAREKHEYAVRHVHQAVGVGYDDFDLSWVKNIGKETKIIVYYSVGYRSEKVAEKLKIAGFANVAILYGGIFV